VYSDGPFWGGFRASVLCGYGTYRPCITWHWTTRLYNTIERLSLIIMGILFWWPVNTPLPEMRLRPLISITYLFSACVAYTILGIVITLAVIFKNASPLPWAGVTANSALFMCPCHGGVYYEDGEVAAGPPPRLLPRYSVRVRNRQVEILASPIPLTTTKWL